MKLRDRPRRALAALVVTAGCAACVAPSTASAFNPVKPICSAAGLLSGIAGKVCAVAQHPGKLLAAGKKLAGGHVGGAVGSLFGGGSGGAPTASTAIGLAAIGVWVLGGAKFALHETAKVLAATTSPQLRSTWFSATYWRIAGIAALLTLPFLFAAAVQALIRSDLAMLARAAFGYLPLAMLAVSVTAPLTMLLLAASDEMSAIVSAAAGNAGTHFLDRASLTIGGLALVSGSPFLAFLVGIFTVAGTIALWLELLMREAAVYVIVLMLPLVFAALVWPARRVWAIRSVEVLIALILSKFAIVAVLALGGAAMSHSVGHSVTGFLAGIVLVMLGAFAPWALIRLMPLSELASGAAGSLRGEARPVRSAGLSADAGAGWGADWAGGLTAGMRREAQAASGTAQGANGGEPVGAAPDPLADLPARAGSAGPASDPGAAAPPDPGAGAPSPDTSAAEPGAPAPPGASSDPVRPPQRSPSMARMWQAEDLSWRTLTLGPEEGWPPPAPWEAGEPPPPSDAGAGGADGAAAPERDREGVAGEDHDPRPPAPGRGPRGGPL